MSRVAHALYGVQEQVEAVLARDAAQRVEVLPVTVVGVDQAHAYGPRLGRYGALYVFGIHAVVPLRHDRDPDAPSARFDQTA